MLIKHNPPASYFSFIPSPFFSFRLMSIRSILVLLTTLSLTLSCSKKDGSAPQPLQFGSTRYDSTALHLALVPNRETLPIYYAARTGLYQRLGLNLQIASYKAQIDCDTALLNRYSDGGWADATRLKSYGRKAQELEMKRTYHEPWQLMVCGTLRIKDAKALKNRTIAVPRLSAEVGVLKQALSAAGLKLTDTYRPQVHSHLLRAQMLTNNQVDATVLTWPYSSLARSAGHRTIYRASDSQQTATGLVLKRHIGRSGKGRKQWELLEKGRLMAIDSLRQKGPQAYSLILQHDYGLPAEVADTIKY